MSLGGRVDRLLDSIPGYAGYRDKERRRNSDRVVREQLALEYGQISERLGRLATTLAQERNIAAISLVDRPHRRLVSFIDRVRTASYGYSPLFSDAPVQEAALDQLAAFDSSLADTQQELIEKISAMESGDSRGPEYKMLSQDLTATIEQLHDRFDKRHSVLHSGEPLPHADVQALLNEPTTTGNAIAYRLHEGEAVEFGGVNYSVVGRVSGDSESASWRAFQLRGGTGDQWLLATSDPSAKLLWLRRVEVSGTLGNPTVTAGGESYTFHSLHSGLGDVIGYQGVASNQPVTFGRYTHLTVQRALVMYVWTSGSLGLVGTEADPGDVQIFSRER